MRFGNFLGICVLASAFCLLQVVPVSYAAGLGCGGMSGSGCFDQTQGCTQYSSTTGACVSYASGASGQQGCTQYSGTTGACVSYASGTSGQQGCTQYSGTTGACVSSGSGASGQQGCTQYSGTTGACVSYASGAPGQQGCQQYSATTGACVSSAAASGQQGCQQYSSTTGACVSPAAGTTGASPASCVGVSLQPGETCSNGVVSCQGGGQCSATASNSSPASSTTPAQSLACTTYSATTGACVANAPAGGAGSGQSGPPATGGVATVTVSTSFAASGGQAAQPPAGASGGTFTLTPAQAGGAATTLTGNASGQASGTIAPGSYTFQQTSPPPGATFLSASLTQAGGRAQSLTPGVATPFSAGVTYAIAVEDQVGGQQAGGTATLSIFNTVTTAGGQPAAGSRAGYSLTLNAQNGTPVQTIVTDQLGQATFSNLQPGVYSLSQSPPPGATFVSMSINGDPAQLQQAFQLQASGNYEVDISNTSTSATTTSGAGSGNASSSSSSGCPSSSIPGVLQDRLWDQACPILPAAVSSTAGAGTSAATSATGSGSNSTARAGSISVGEVVQVTGTGNGLNVRSSPDTSASIVTSLSDGSTATVMGGPQTGDGYTWWQLDAGGWAVGDYLTPSSSQPAGS